MKKINQFCWALFMVPCSFLGAVSQPQDQGGLGEGGKGHIENVANLPQPEQQVYHQLGPLYQKIYLNVFNDEERHRVVVYISRGLTSYEAINTILRAEQRKYTPNQKNQSITPLERSSKSSPSKQEVL